MTIINMLNYWFALQVYGEASIIFPLLVSQTFAKNFVPETQQQKDDKNTAHDIIKQTDTVVNQDKVFNG